MRSGSSREAVVRRAQYRCYRGFSAVGWLGGRASGFFFSSRRRHTRLQGDWSSDVCSSDLFLVGVFWGFYRTPESRRNWLAIKERIDQCAQHFQLLDRMLADRAFLLGDRLSLGDIPIGTNLYRYFNLEIDRPSVPNVEAWYRRLQDRSAYRTHVMVPFGELRGRLEY